MFFAKDMQSMEENVYPIIQSTRRTARFNGESSEPRKRKKQYSDSHPKSCRRTFSQWRLCWSKSKVRTYKSGQRTGPTTVSSQGSRRTDTRTPTRRTFRLVNRMFREQIGKSMEAYVDDMLVKSLRSNHHWDEVEPG
ncbi:UNVERIFIED_CONTAM: hypothetical protein Sindi_0984200 [Sesamum indicum]